jgi:hypothetical protein
MFLDHLSICNRKKHTTYKTFERIIKIIKEGWPWQRYTVWEHISYWLLGFRFPWIVQTNSYGILRFRWRFSSLCGVYYVTGYPQKQTYSLETSYLLQLICAFLVVKRRSRPIIYSSHAVLLVLFRHWCVRGLTSRWWTTFPYVITSSGLHIQQTILGHVAPSCSLFSLLVLELCGQREIGLFWGSANTNS